MRRFSLALLLFTAAGPAAAQAPPAPEGKPVSAEVSVQATLVAAFEAALAGDLQAYLATLHPESKETEVQRKQLERFEWQRFSRQAAWYLVSKAPVSFEVVRRGDTGPNSTRVFVKDQKNKDRMPVPVRLKRHRTGWKITANSL